MAATSRVVCIILCAIALSTTFVGRTSAQPATSDVRAASHEEAIESSDVALIRQLARNRGGDPAALAQVIQLARTLDPATAAELYDELAEAHLRTGRLELAAEARRVLAEQFPDSPRATRALMWLVRLYASSEVAHAHRQPSASAANLNRQLAPAVAANGELAPQADAMAESRDAMAAYALGLANQFAMSREDLKQDAAFAFQRSVAARRAGETKAALGLLTGLKHRAAGDAWGECARAEHWLIDGRDEAPPKPTTVCVRAASPPVLDGELQEPYWQGEQCVALSQRNSSSKPQFSSAPADVRLAFDDDYLYVAVSCVKQATASYPRDERPRPHDGDVEAYDHVRLWIDLDRDYATWFELVVDSRGWTADRAWSDAAWNPQWFVAASQGASTLGQRWTAEAAIPWSELARRPPQAGDVWSLAVARSTPDGETRQTWCGPAAASPSAECFGLLLFD